MTDGVELQHRCCANTLRRRVGNNELRVLLFKLTQATHETVVLGVWDLRLVEHVISIVVFFDLLTKRRRFCTCGRLGACTHRELAELTMLEVVAVLNHFLTEETLALNAP